MFRCRSLAIVRLLLLVGLCWLATTGLALADEEQAKPAEKSYVFGYALVALGIALGLVGVLMPGRRTTSHETLREREARKAEAVRELQESKRNEIKPAAKK